MRLRSLVVCALFMGSPLAAAGQAMLPPPKPPAPPASPPLADIERSVQTAEMSHPVAMSPAMRLATFRAALAARVGAAEARRLEDIAKSSLRTDTSDVATLGALRAVVAAASDAPTESGLDIISTLNTAFGEQAMAVGVEALRMSFLDNRALVSVYGAAARTEGDAETVDIGGELVDVTAQEFRDRANVIGRILNAGGPLAVRGSYVTQNGELPNRVRMMAYTGVVSARSGLTGAPQPAGSGGLEVTALLFEPGTVLLRTSAPDKTATGLRLLLRGGLHTGLGGDLAEGMTKSLLFAQALVELVVEGKAAFGLNYIHIGPKEWRPYAWHGLYLNFSGYK